MIKSKKDMSQKIDAIITETLEALPEPAKATGSNVTLLQKQAYLIAEVASASNGIFFSSLTNEEQAQRVQRVLFDVFGVTIKAHPKPNNDQPLQLNRPLKKNKHGIVTRGFTVDECIREHKKAWGHWPYFNEPRKIWRDEEDQLCIEYVNKQDLTTSFYRYSVQDGYIVWG